MREIVVNGRFLSRRTTGVERYGRGILPFIGSRSRVEKTRANGVMGHLWEQFVLPTKLNSESILWSPANTGPILVRDQALTIHDLSPIEHPEWYKKSFAVWYRLFLPILARRVRVVFTPSMYVKNRVIKRFDVEKAVITPNAVDPSCFYPGAQQSLYELPERFILFVGALQPGKNLQTLLNAWDKIKDEYSDFWLLIAGDMGSVFKKTELTMNERVQFLGYVEDDVLPGLYAKATLFVLPSEDEGFGLPAIEAMACGTPVIVSDGGALPEVVGAAGLVFELSDPAGLTERIQECLSDPKLRLSMKEKGLVRAQIFSWQKTSDLIWNTLNAI